MSSDPFELLGVARTASIAEVRAARRRLAFELHPDRGGDEATMQSVNVAFEACIAHLTGRRPLSPSPAPGPAPTPAPRQRRRGRGHVEHDSPSFTVDALPAETFEALLVVAAWIGEVLTDEPPYLLECHLNEPSPCWCRLDVVPDAGSSTVSIIVVTEPDDERVSAEMVRDVWVEHLNQLGRPTP